MSCSLETLMRQAPKTMAEYLRDSIKYIDEECGEGYALNHDKLIAAFIIGSSIDYLAGQLKNNFDNSECFREELTIGLESIASSIKQSFTDSDL